MESRLPVMRPCPACGAVEALVAHLRTVHGFPHRRALGIASRIATKERLSRSDCATLGIPTQPVTFAGQLSRATAQAPAMVPGLPSDADLDRAIAAAFPS